MSGVRQFKHVLLPLIATPSGRSHAAVLSGAEGESAHRGSCCRLCPVHGTWQHRGLHALHVWCEDAAGRKGACSVLDSVVNTVTDNDFLSPCLSPTTAAHY